MTDDHHPDGTENRPDDYQRAVESCEHAADALRSGDLAHARTLLEEAHSAVERVQHADSTQEQREIADDCYD